MRNVHANTNIMYICHELFFMTIWLFTRTDPFLIFFFGPKVSYHTITCLMERNTKNKRQTVFFLIVRVELV